MVVHGSPSSSTLTHAPLGSQDGLATISENPVRVNKRGPGLENAIPGYPGSGREGIPERVCTGRASPEYRGVPWPGGTVVNPQPLVSPEDNNLIGNDDTAVGEPLAYRVPERHHPTPGNSSVPNTRIVASAPGSPP